MKFAYYVVFTVNGKYHRNEFVLKSPIISINEIGLLEQYILQKLIEAYPKRYEPFTKQNKPLKSNLVPVIVNYIYMREVPETQQTEEPTIQPVEE